MAVKVFSDDMVVMNDTAAHVLPSWRRSGRVGSQGQADWDFPHADRRYRPRQDRRYGLNVGDVRNAIATAVADEGLWWGRGDRRFDISCAL